MMRLCGVLFAAAAVLALAADDKKDDAAKDEMKKLEGTWLVISLEGAGEKAPADVVKVMKVVVKGDKFTQYVGDMVVNEGTFSVDPTKKPKTMDSVKTGDPNKGEKMLAIYQLDGDKLKSICITGEKERPKEFATKKGEKTALYEYKREKK